MERKPRNLGRAYLVEKLQERGYSRRQAVRILDFVFREMSKALARGEDVEFPLGWLTRERRHFSDYWDDVDDWPANRQGYTVEWYLDEAGVRLVYPGAPNQRRSGGRRRTG